MHWIGLFTQLPISVGQKNYRKKRSCPFQALDRCFSGQQTATLSRNPRGAEVTDDIFKCVIFQSSTFHFQFRGQSFNICQTLLQEITGFFKGCWGECKGCVYIWWNPDSISKLLLLFSLTLMHQSFIRNTQWVSWGQEKEHIGTFVNRTILVRFSRNKSWKWVSILALLGSLVLKSRSF